MRDQMRSKPQQSTTFWEKFDPAPALIEVHEEGVRISLAGAYEGSISAFQVVIHCSRSGL